MKRLSLIAVALVLSSWCAAPQPVRAADVSEYASAYREAYSLMNLDVTKLTVPTVVEITLPTASMKRGQVAVRHTDLGSQSIVGTKSNSDMDAKANQATTGSDEFVPVYYREGEPITPVVSLETVPAQDDAFNATDNQADTYADFALPEGQSEASVIFKMTMAKPLTANALMLTLDSNVTLPTDVAVTALDGGTRRVVVARTRVKGTTVSFLSNQAENWEVTLWYRQPLRVRELRLRPTVAPTPIVLGVRFLAQPGNHNTSYRVYANPDRDVTLPVGEAGDLATAKNVMKLDLPMAYSNFDYKPADVDNDRVMDAYDNCPKVYNPNQQDIDHNGVGDACDDFDRDGLINLKDNCPNDPNRDQADRDGDGIGDACDHQESRLTESQPWLPWAGIGFAAAVLIALTFVVARSMRQEDPQA